MYIQYDRRHIFGKACVLYGDPREIHPPSVRNATVRRGVLPTFRKYETYIMNEIDCAILYVDTTIKIWKVKSSTYCVVEVGKELSNPHCL